MKRKTKIIVAIIIMLIMAIFISGCSVEKIQPRYGLVRNTEYQPIEAFEFREYLETSEITPEKASDEIEDEIHELEESLVQYINDEYGLDWEVSGAEIYQVDFSKISGFETFNALAEPKYNSFYLSNSGMIFNEEGIEYISAHELIHCLSYKNIGTYRFVLKDENGNELGYYTSEAFTDLLTIEFFENQGREDVRSFFYSNSGYCYTACALSMLEKSIPNAMKYFLTNDTESLETDFNKLANKYIEVPEGFEENLFKSFLYRADMNMVAAMSIATYGITDEYAYIFVNSAYGNFEEVVIMSKGLEKEVQEDIYEECINLYKSEGELTEDILDFAEHLKSCIG